VTYASNSEARKRLAERLAQAECPELINAAPPPSITCAICGRALQPGDLLCNHTEVEKARVRCDACACGIPTLDEITVITEPRERPVTGGELGASVRAELRYHAGTILTPGEGGYSDAVVVAEGLVAALDVLDAAEARAAVAESDEHHWRSQAAEAMANEENAEAEVARLTAERNRWQRAAIAADRRRYEAQNDLTEARAKCAGLSDRAGDHRARAEVLEAENRRLAALIKAVKAASAHPHKGPDDTDASMLRAAAKRLRGGYEPGGSNTKQTVANVCVAVADLIDGGAE
jgi:hypothetical protein